jgi:sulfate transport system permease protein
MLGQIENDNLAGASAVATVLLIVALIVIILLGILQRRAANRG